MLPQIQRSQDHKRCILYRAMQKIRYKNSMQVVEHNIASVFYLVEEMFDRVDTQMANVINALLTGDTELAEHVRFTDKKIDELELQIDEMCENILQICHQQGRQLREVLAVMRINNNLERIGDLCRNLAKKVEMIATPVAWQSDTHLPEMADAVRLLVCQARDSFMEKNRLKARQILAKDRQIDRAYRATLQRIIDMSQDYPRDTGVFIHLAAINKMLERIADHAKNIARSVVYLIEGVDIRHPILTCPTAT